MADVSVRFQVAGDAEVVLNLSTPQAVRLLEAIARKVGEVVGPAGGGAWAEQPAPVTGNRNSPS